MVITGNAIYLMDLPSKKLIQPATVFITQHWHSIMVALLQLQEDTQSELKHLAKMAGLR